MTMLELRVWRVSSLTRDQSKVLSPYSGERWG